MEIEKERVSFSEWFEGCVKNSPICKVIVGDLTKGKEWKFLGTHVGREDNRYYRGTLVNVESGGKLMERFLLQSTSGERIHGIVLLARSIDGLYLVQAKPEVGNKTPGCVVLTTTLQASLENLSHNKIPFCDYINDENTKYIDVPQDPGMLFGKINRIAFLQLNERSFEMDIPATHSWATIEDVMDLARRGLVSEFLLQALGFYVLLSLV